MESSAIAVLVPTVTTQNGVMAAEAMSTQGSDGTPSPFSRMLSDATEPSAQVAVHAEVEAALTVAVPLSVQLSAEIQQAFPVSSGGEVPSLLSDRGVLSTLLAFQSVMSPLPTSGGVAQGGEESVEAGNVLLPISPVQADAGEAVAVQESPAEASGEGQEALDTAAETTAVLLASAMQSQQQLRASSSPEPQKRPDTALEIQSATESAIGGMPIVAEASLHSRAGLAAAASAPTPPAGKVEPAPQVSAAVVAGIASSLDKTAATAESVGTDREAPAVDGEERSAQAVPLSGRFPKQSLRGGHGPGSIQKDETPAPIPNDPVFNRPLLEIVVEGAAAETSEELAAKPATVDTDVAAVGKPTHSLIGGAVGIKVEPAPVSTAGETVRAPSHEQILSQVKEQFGKAEFRADDGRVVLQLHPEELGSLRIDVKMDDQRLRLHIVAENPTVRDALVANMDSLKESLSKQQIVMERFDVSTGQGQDQQQLFREHRQQVQYGQVHRPNRPATEYAEDGEVLKWQAQAAYWAPQDGGLLNVRF